MRESVPVAEDVTLAPLREQAQKGDSVTAEHPEAQAHHDKMFQLIMAAWGSQAIRTLASLSVAEHLESEALTAQQIAGRESSDPAMTYRVLRAGVALGVLEYDAATQAFSSTPMLQVLHEDSPVS